VAQRSLLERRTVSVILKEAMHGAVRALGFWRRLKNPATQYPKHDRLRGALSRPRVPPRD
jgi:hypothetical protein